MKRVKLLGIFAGVLLVCCAASAQEKGYWRAASNTARSITGDVSLSAEKIVINFSSFTIAPIRALQPAELSALFDAEDGGGSGNLYRLNVPGSKRFTHKNTLCGSDDTQWMATYVAGHSLYLAFFSGPKPPELTLEALANSTDHCGTFIYQR